MRSLPPGSLFFFFILLPQPVNIPTAATSECISQLVFSNLCWCVCATMCACFAGRKAGVWRMSIQQTHHLQCCSKEWFLMKWRELLWVHLHSITSSFTFNDFFLNYVLNVIKLKSLFKYFSNIKYKVSSRNIGKNDCVNNTFNNYLC